MFDVLCGFLSSFGVLSCSEVETTGFSPCFVELCVRLLGCQRSIWLVVVTRLDHCLPWVVTLVML